MDAHGERLQSQLNGLSHGVAGLRTSLSNLKDHLLVTATENQTFLKKTVTNLLTGTKLGAFFAPLTTTDDDPIEDCLSGYAKRLEGYENQLKSSLEGQGINWKVDYHQVPRSMTVSTTSEDPHIAKKACQILKLLAYTTVDPSLILEIVDGSMEHVHIGFLHLNQKFKIEKVVRRKFMYNGGDMKFEVLILGGFNLTHFVQKVKLKWDELSRRSIKKMAKMTRCKLFLTNCTLTAVGTSDGLEMLRTMVEGIFLHGVDLAQTVKIECKESNDTVEKSLAESSMCSFTEYYGEDRAKRVQDVWPMVKSFLQENGISCEMSACNRSMKVSTTTEIKDRDRIVRARRLLELLGRTNVPPSLAIEIMNGRKQHIFMKIGQQEGGLCSRFGIEKVGIEYRFPNLGLIFVDVVEYEDRLRRFCASIEEIIGLTGANLYHYEDTVTLVGGAVGQSEDLEMARIFVEGYIVHNVEGDCVTKLNLMKSEKRKDRGGDDALATCPCEDIEEQMEDDLVLPFFDLPRIESATNYFSINNKLGEGGFGPSKRLDGYDNQLKSSLEGQGINWKVDYHQVPRSMIVSTTGGDPHITNKACQILKLLAYTTVDPSLKMAKMTRCKLFLNDCTLTAMGTSDGLEMLRTMVEGIFLHAVDLAQIVKIKCKESNDTVEKVACALSLNTMVKTGCNRSMKVSTTTEIKDRDHIVRARRLLELLGRTNVPPSLVKYEDRLRRFRASIEDIIGLIGINLYHYEDTVTLVGGVVGQSEDLEMARTLVEGYIVHDVENDCVTKLKLMKSEKRKDRLKKEKIEEEKTL
ncbi:hypothetical protein D8674_021914 [Pyrus ussuriensis x Pyrus communis]|uniref:KRR-R motif-containing protein 1 n=1 Tax=Pyrus ussuriensis x Pyrus communis TaxID=2448454 RepID=A0A5N5GIF9_9ROSA|nr:hypothetical protein D8674_021914 [Pyrus ussuriensis x Pyrus communis]